MRQFGNTKGTCMKRQVMNQYMYVRSIFVVNLIDKILTLTSRKKRPRTKKRGKTKYIDEMKERNVQQEELAATLTYMEKRMNGNALLHPVLEEFPNINTEVKVCPHCSQKLLNFGYDVHLHEYHSGAICNEVDDTVFGRMKAEAAL